MRERAERDIALLQDTFDSFRDLAPKQIVEDEMIWRELKDRFGDYFKGVPSRLGYLLDIAPKDLEKVIYFAASIITSVDEAKRHKDLPNLEEEIGKEVSYIEERRDNRLAEILKETEGRLEEMEARKARSSEKKAAMNQS